MRILTRGRFLFSREKHFVDTFYNSNTLIYADARALSADHPGNLAKLCDVFSSNEVNLSYLRTHFVDHKKGDKERMYEVDFSFSSSHKFNFDKAKE